MRETTSPSPVYYHFRDLWVSKTRFYKVCTDQGHCHALSWTTQAEIVKTFSSERKNLRPKNSAYHIPPKENLKKISNFVSSVRNLKVLRKKCFSLSLLENISSHHQQPLCRCCENIAGKFIGTSIDRIRIYGVWGWRCCERKKKEEIKLCPFLNDEYFPSLKPWHFLCYLCSGA